MKKLGITNSVEALEFLIAMGQAIEKSAESAKFFLTFNDWNFRLQNVAGQFNRTKMLLSVL